MYDPLDLADFIARRRKELLDLGMHIQTRDDFETLYDLEIEGKTISPMFSPRHHDLLDQRARWICGTIDNEIVHVQAYRMIDTGEASMERALGSEFSRIFGNPALSDGRISDALEDMRGRVIYHGDLWCHSKLRGTGAGERLGALGVASAMMTFDPDYVVGFMEQPLAGRGFFFREGYHHIEPLGSGWRRGAPFLLESDWLVFCTRQSLRKLVVRDCQLNRVKQPATVLEPS
jgi:hypothetical protein